VYLHTRLVVISGTHKHKDTGCALPLPINIFYFSKTSLEQWSSGLLRRVVFWLYVTDIPEDSHLHTHRRENLQSHPTEKFSIRICLKLVKINLTENYCKQLYLCFINSNNYMFIPLLRQILFYSQ
jgi:hypothetical protein